MPACFHKGGHQLASPAAPRTLSLLRPTRFSCHVQVGAGLARVEEDPPKARQASRQGIPSRSAAPALELSSPHAALYGGRCVQTSSIWNRCRGSSIRNGLLPGTLAPACADRHHRSLTLGPDARARSAQVHGLLDLPRWLVRQPLTPGAAPRGTYRLHI
jgi:hypothetical protein